MNKENSHRENTSNLKQVNASGFPLQIAIEHIAKNSYSKHNWDVISTEFPWEKGFIDIVLRRNNQIMLVECKRCFDDNWIFLISDTNKLNVVGCRLEWFNGKINSKESYSKTDNSGKNIFCDEFIMEPSTPESECCVLPKKSSITLLENLSCNLLESSHSIGDLPELSHENDFEPLIPVIVTTAKILTCSLDSDDVDLSKGNLSNGKFESKKFIRFRKSLVSYRSDEYNDKLFDLRELKTDRERTVFIVNAEYFLEFLENLKDLKHNP